MNDIVRSKITNKTIYNINKTNFDDAMTEFIINISNIQFPPSFIHCGRKLYVSRTEMYYLMNDLIRFHLKQFFKQDDGISYLNNDNEYYKTGDGIYENGYCLLKLEVALEKALDILTKAQKGKLNIEL